MKAVLVFGFVLCGLLAVLICPQQQELPAIETMTDQTAESPASKLAGEILAEITTEGMTDMEVAFAIYRWTGSNIAYVGSSDKTDWGAAAYRGFTERIGDCYTYFAVAKALFIAAGIENMDVVKCNHGGSSHYWSLINLGDGWYHVDCTPRRSPGRFFMNTDAELESYSQANNNSHIFEGSLYPRRATKSVQHLIDYENGRIQAVPSCG